MSTIAIVPSDVPSKRMLATNLARMLVAAGHRAVLLLDERDDGVGTGGIEQRRVVLRPPDRTVARGRVVERWRANRSAAASFDPVRFDAALEAIEPDLLVIDIEEYEALILALALARPLAVLCSFFDPWPISGLGPDDPGPAGGRLDRLRGDLRWWVLWGRLRVHDAKRHLDAGDLDRIAVSRRLARRLRVRQEFTARQWLHPFAPARSPMLVCNALELDIPHRPRAGVVHVGSIPEPAPRPETIDDPELASFVARARASDRALVVCAFGTLATGRRDALLERVADVARLRPDHRFVVGTGADVRPARFDGLANVFAAPWIPQRALLEVADAAIVHTGNATLHECVAAQVPMLACPLGVNDQRRNAARVVRHGVGVVGDVRHDGAAFAERLDLVLGDVDLRDRIADLAADVTRYDRDHAAVAAVEELLRDGGRHVTAVGRTRP